MRMKKPFAYFTDRSSHFTLEDEHQCRLLEQDREMGLSEFIVTCYAFALEHGYEVVEDPRFQLSYPLFLEKGWMKVSPLIHLWDDDGNVEIGVGFLYYVKIDEPDVTYYIIYNSLDGRDVYTVRGARVPVPMASKRQPLFHRKEEDARNELFDSIRKVSLRLLLR